MKPDEDKVKGKGFVESLMPIEKKKAKQLVKKEKEEEKQQVKREKLSLTI